MKGLQVAVHEETGGAGLADARRALESAGYEVTGTKDPSHFQSVVPSANCALVLTYRIAGNLIPSRLDGAYVPPVIVISPLPKDEVTRDMQSVDVLHQVLAPAPRDRVLVRAVTHAVITDIFARLGYAADHQPDWPELVRSAIRTVASGKTRTVTRLADSVGVSRRTFERHWLRTFGADAPEPKQFCRGIWLLRILASAVSEPVLVWSRFCAGLEISWSTFRGAAVTLAGHMPSELDLARDPATIVSRVCERAFPPELLEPVPGDEPT